MGNVQIRWPDGATASFPSGTEVVAAARAWNAADADRAVAAKIDGQSVDLHTSLQQDCSLELLLPGNPDALEVYRHTTAHILAHAVKELFPDVKIGVGPVTEDGFYYDFEKKEPFTPEDLQRIESRMRKIIKRNFPLRRLEQKKEEARDYFQSIGEDLKVYLIETKGGPVVSTYQQDGFIDFCRGPHLPSTGHVKAFKLLSIAGAYWLGTEKNQMLQRIYGTSFFDSKQLEEFLQRQEEARKRDHRKLGPALDLFSVREEAGAGLIFWHPAGARLRAQIEEFWKSEHIKRGYEFVYTPHIARDELWRRSGHLDFYREHLYTFKIDQENYVIKPMNCPGHILIYQSTRRSYRELPIRMAELGTVYRYERSGVLHGTMRVRGFTQDDAHIFCTKEQILDELIGVIDMSKAMLDVFGYRDYQVELSVWDPEHPKKYAGKAEDWDLAEKCLVEALERSDLPYQRMPGEAAFYGPKIDIRMRDALGRSWQCPTIQFDFNLPERLGVTYIAADGRERPVVMIHRAILGSLERFIGGLVEHYGGAFPMWMAPVQAIILPITDRTMDYARQVTSQLRSEGLRVELDSRNEKIGQKIRKAQLRKIPFMLITGDREEKENTVSVRNRFEGDMGGFTLVDFLSYARELVDAKALKP
ncbi:MAG: threonine--tRNA ligase [Acidobacteriota bacterium]